MNYNSHEYLQDILIRLAHHSTAIEGNTLTLGETKSIILNNYIPRSMDAREYFEVANFKKYLPYLLKNSNKDISQEIIKETHYILMENLRDDRGKYKKVQNAILGSNIQTTPPYMVISELENWCNTLSYRLQESTSDDEKTFIIMEQHLRFERIHPFPDGNGRTGRALILHSCMKENIPPILITKDIKSEYILALDEQNMDSLYNLAKRIQRSEIKRNKAFLEQDITK